MPRSGHGAVATSVFSDPEGSTKICIRVFEREVTGVAGGGAAKTSWFAVARELDLVTRVRDDDDEVDDSPSITFLDVIEVRAEGCSDATGRRDVGDIIRFWNSRCLASRRSKGAARRAIPSK